MIRSEFSKHTCRLHCDPLRLSLQLRRYVPVRLDIPSATMTKKLEPLLKDEPGTFSHHPTVVSGLIQLQRFKRADIGMRV
jgi:hypothetical protein